MAPTGGFRDGDALDAERAGEAPALVPAFFWGICDIKYDPRLPEGERIRVLELGDGRSSRFSHHGTATREKFRAEYCLAQRYLKLDVLMENKRLTHQRFVREGFAHLRPSTACYPRCYSPDLAARVARDLGPAAREAVVLKLCNRNRGAGVVVVPLGRLDAALKRLLRPPGRAELEALLAQLTAKPLLQKQEAFEEQCLHWWSNECPCFLAEACCHSLPVILDHLPGHAFDGTMRVAFALRKPRQADAADGCFEVDWLGGYWKLPPTAAPPPGGAGLACATLEEARARVVSSFSTAEKRTAEVEKAHLAEVYAALAPALLRVLRVAGAIDVQSLMADHRDEPDYCAFLLARVAATMWVEKTRQAKGLLGLAKGMVVAPPEFDAQHLPECSVLSYIDRIMGICCILEQPDQKQASLLAAKRLEASKKLQASIDWMPTNSMAYYVKGRYLHDQERFQQGAEFLLKAIALDPDFKQSYLALGNCLLRMTQFQRVIEVSRACLCRHKDSPTAHFNLGQAYYHMVRGGLLPEEGIADACATAADALQFAKGHDAPRVWKCGDEGMLEYFLAGAEERAELPAQALRTRRVFGWRP